MSFFTPPSSQFNFFHVIWPSFYSYPHHWVIKERHSSAVTAAQERFVSGEGLARNSSSWPAFLHGFIVSFYHQGATSDLVSVSQLALFVNLKQERSECVFHLFDVV